MAALTVLKEEKLTENAAAMGEIFRAECKKMDYPWIKDIRGRGYERALKLIFRVILK